MMNAAFIFVQGFYLSIPKAIYTLSSVNLIFTKVLSIYFLHASRKPGSCCHHTNNLGTDMPLGTPISYCHHNNNLGTDMRYYAQAEICSYTIHVHVFTSTG